MNKRVLSEYEKNVFNIYRLIHKNMSKEKFEWTDENVKAFCEYAGLRIGKSKDIGEQIKYLLQDFKSSKEVKKDYEILGYDVDRNIACVRRISDDEIFTIGDKILHGTIKGFSMAGNEITIDCANGNQVFLTLGNHLKEVKKPLFTTEDGVEIFEGGNYWEVYEDFTTIPYHDIKPNWTLETRSKSFSTEDAAKEFILLKKPLLSLQDLLDNWAGLNNGGNQFKSSPMFQYFKKVAQQKLKL